RIDHIFTKNQKTQKIRSALTHLYVWRKALYRIRFRNSAYQVGLYINFISNLYNICHFLMIDDLNHLENRNLYMKFLLLDMLTIQSIALRMSVLAEIKNRGFITLF
ncbi:hypothetical protein, partial [Cysteiniphilum marinum]|uniref:hypothetical protein n=1 Tax=Cysteiniphilum marinum TaxID=2774191 RepID=UPI001F400FAF